MAEDRFEDMDLGEDPEKILKNTKSSITQGQVVDWMIENNIENIRLTVEARPGNKVAIKPITRRFLKKPGQ